MIKIGIGNITPLLESSKFEHYVRQLPKHRRDKAKRQKMPLKKAQSVGAGILWEQMKKKYGLTDKDSYNLSHSGEFVICAAAIGKKGDKLHPPEESLSKHSTKKFAPIKVGCDIEKIREIDEKLSQRFFTSSEVERLKQESTKEGRRALFFRLWVLKESYMKATGLGMKLDMRSFEIKLGSPSIIAKQPKEHSDQYHLHEFATNHHKYRVAVCTTDQWVDTNLTEFVF